jgi:hypothetical protein
LFSLGIGTANDQILWALLPKLRVAAGLSPKELDQQIIGTYLAVRAFAGTAKWGAKPAHENRG